jgi:Ubiquinol-cytochrome c reductase 8 kDa, N-terminal
MINIASKAGSYLRATNQVVASGLKPLAGAALAEKKVNVDNSTNSSLNSLTQQIPIGNVSVRSGITSKFLLMQSKEHPVVNRAYNLFCLKNYITS